jgi:hypothetical protein
MSLSVAEVSMLRMWLPSHIDDLQRASWVGEPWEIWKPQLEASRSLLKKICDL